MFDPLTEQRSRKRRGRLIGGIVLGVVGFVAAVSALAALLVFAGVIETPLNPTLADTAEQSAAELRQMQDDGKQATRLAEIDRLTEAKLLVRHGLEGPATATVTAAPPFFIAKLADQNRVLRTVWEYHNIADGAVEPMVVRLDNGSVKGRRVGTYEPLEGFDPED